jgi:hypothetical protein
MCLICPGAASAGIDARVPNAVAAAAAAVVLRKLLRFKEPSDLNLVFGKYRAFVLQPCNGEGGLHANHNITFACTHMLRIPLLVEYYAGEGTDDPVIIELPKGRVSTGFAAEPRADARG